MSAAQIVAPYFEARWWRAGVPAAQAFDAAKASAVAALKRQIAEIDALTFGAFAAQCCHASVTADSVHGGRDDG